MSVNNQTRKSHSKGTPFTTAAHSMFMVHSVPALAPLGATERCDLMMKDPGATRLRQKKGKTTDDREHRGGGTANHNEPRSKPNTTTSVDGPASSLTRYHQSSTRVLAKFMRAVHPEDTQTNVIAPTTKDIKAAQALLRLAAQVENHQRLQGRRAPGLISDCNP